MKCYNYRKFQNISEMCSLCYRFVLWQHKPNLGSVSCVFSSFNRVFRWQGSFFEWLGCHLDSSRLQFDMTSKIIAPDKVSHLRLQFPKAISDVCQLSALNCHDRWEPSLSLVHAGNVCVQELSVLYILSVWCAQLFMHTKQTQTKNRQTRFVSHCCKSLAGHVSIHMHKCESKMCS